MTVTAARLRAVVTADTSQGQTGLKGFGRQVTQTAATARRDISSMGGAFRDLGFAIGPAMTAFGVAFGASQIVSFAKDTITAASDSSEAINKMEVVFGNISSTITSFANTAAHDLGMSKTRAVEAVGTFGNLFTSMGLGVQPAADMSQGLVQLAADLGSFNNIPVGEMLEKLRSGLVGEVEPLRAVGINLSAAAVNARALQMGLADSNGTVSQAALLQARYALILDQSKNAQGDFARTSDGLANSLKIAESEVADLKVSLGELTIKPYTAVVRVVSEVVGNLNTDVKAGSDDPMTRLVGLQAQIERTRASYTQMLTGGQLDDPNALVMIMEYRQTLSDLIDEYNYLKTASAESSDAGVAGFRRTGAAAAALAAPVAEAATFADDLGKALDSLRGKEAGAQVNAVAAAILAGKLNEAEVAAHGLTWALDQIKQPTIDPRGAGYAAYDAGRKQGADLREAAIVAGQIIQDRWDKARAANTAIANDYAGKMKTAGSEIASALKGDMSSGMNTAIGLLDLRGPEANDPNGPFRDIFRVLDVAKLGGASPWQQGLGIDQETAKGIGAKFEKGIWDDTVTRFIDVDALKAAVKEKQLGQQFMDAFAESLADGSSGGSTGKDKKAGVGDMVIPAMLKSIDAQLVADASKLEDKGAVAFDKIQKGFIDQATNSTAFISAINAMVDNSLARYTGAE